MPPDLASRISQLAQCCGRSPESFLRDALCAWMEADLPLAATSTLETPETLDSNPSLQQRFVPQQAAFSVYE